jgi:hypothetical protein
LSLKRSLYTTKRFNDQHRFISTRRIAQCITLHSPDANACMNYAQLRGFCVRALLRTFFVNVR